MIQVQDNGSGIPPEFMPRVFDLFARGESDLHRSPGGLGIGLTLVKRIAELHGGYVSALSDGPGLGSSFTVELPRMAAAETYRREPDGRPKDEIKPRRILLIEDSDDVRAPLCALLEASGHQLYEAAEGPGGC